MIFVGLFCIYVVDVCGLSIIVVLVLCVYNTTNQYSCEDKKDMFDL